MTYDPNRDRETSRAGGLRRDTSPWAWIIGIAVVVVLGFIVWAAVDNNPEVAGTDQPATEQSAPRETTGAAPPATSPKPNPAPPAGGTNQ